MIYPLSLTTLLPIASFFGISINQLVGLEPIPADTQGYLEQKMHWLKVPIITWQETIHWSDYTSLEFSNNFVCTEVDVGKKPYALTVNDDDWMSSGILKNSILIINSEMIPTHKDYAVVYKSGLQIPTLKQVIIDEDKICLKSLNPYFSAIPLDNEHKFLGVVIQIRSTRQD